MSYTPHTDSDVQEMLEAMQLDNVEQLFSELPTELPAVDFSALPAALSEYALTREVAAALPDTALERCFIGAGAYPHHIPAAVAALISRGEFLTSYTPYQAEASQGQLQVIYEFQSMMTNLLAMDVANASMYDGATSLVESLLMAVRIKRGKQRRVLCPSSLSPGIKEVISTYLTAQSITVSWLDIDAAGRICWPQEDLSDVAACVIAQPNFLGVLEDIETIVPQAKAAGMLLVAYVNPLSVALLEAPGAWPAGGADIVCGSGQPLGVALSYGGPYFGFLACKKSYIRQLPGRIVGRTIDAAGKTAFSLTLQAREQHIRRAKATSNICTNQGLMVTAATVYMSLLGTKGLRNAISASSNHHLYLLELLSDLGLQPTFVGPTLMETAVNLPVAASKVIAGLADKGILAGYDLGRWDARYSNSLLLCTTEVHTKEDCLAFAAALKLLLGEVVPC